MELNLKCELEYSPRFMSKEEADRLFNYLIGIAELTNMHQSNSFTNEPLDHNFGKLMFINDALFHDNAFPQEIWGRTKIWSEEILWLKEKIEHHTNNSFDVCVCIYYPDGHSGITYHTDFIAYGDTSLIPSMSLGEEREFRLREIETKQESIMILEHGSLLIMGKHCQELYEHSLPVNPKYKHPRINMTFRKYGFY